MFSRTPTSYRVSKVLFSGFLAATFLVSGLFVPSAYAAGPANDFAVLARTAVTATDAAIIGDVGTFQAPLEAPPGSVTLTNSTVDGTVHIGDAVAKAAYNAFLAEYEALAPTPGYCNTAHTITGTLAGVTLTPGTYCVTAEAKTGLLTLNGGGSYTFLVSGALTGTNFTVVLTNGAEACDVTWWVDAAATMTDSNFIGTILAGAAITMTDGTFHGNAYAGADGVGDVTITGTEVTGCEGSSGNGNNKSKCNQGVGNGPETCDPGNSNQGDPSRSNDELGGTPSTPGRQGGNR